MSKLDFLSIVGGYWETHILTKCRCTILEGQKNFFTEIQAHINLFSGSNDLGALKQNCCFAHLQNLLLAMMGDEDKIARAKAVNVI